MTDNASYTHEYFAIMDGLQGDVQGRRAAYGYMQRSTAICHHEVVDASFVPRLYNADTYEAFRHYAETTHQILCKVIERYLEDPAYRSVFSIDERLRDLILLPRGYDSLLPFARVDVFLDEESLTAAFCEFNADGSSGMNEDREIVASISSSESFRLFSERHSTRPAELFESWVGEFIRIYESYEHRIESPRFAICDFLENAVIDEFKIYQGLFEKHGFPCTICDVRDLVFDGTVLVDGSGGRIDAIWRRSVTNDIVEFWDGSQPLIEAVRAEKVALIGSFAGHLVHDKQIFQVLHDRRTQSFLTEEEVRFICETVPYTAFLDSTVVDLDQIKAEKDLWIIKPTDHYGADNVYAGSFWSQEEWEGLIDRFADSAAGYPFLVQRYCTPFKTWTLPPDAGIEGLSDEEVGCKGALYNNLQGLYLYNGRFAGVFSRMGPLPTISKDMQGMTAATIWVDCEH